MAAKSLVFTLVALALTVFTGFAQQKTLPKLPDYTDQQRWARANFVTDVLLAASLAYAKSVGHNADEYTQYCVKIFGPTWGKPDSVHPIGVLRGMRRNWLSWSDLQFEIIDSTANMVKGRFSRPYVSKYFTDNSTLFEITKDEFESFFRNFNRGICDYLHLQYTDQVDGDWIAFTIAKR